MKRFRKRTVIYITITAILLSLFSVSSLTLAAFATDDGESSAVSQPEYTPAPVLPIEMVVPSDALYMNYPDVAAALECLPVEPLPDTVTLFQYFERLQTVQWLEAEIDYAEMPADEAAALTDTYVTSFYTRAKELGLDKYVPISNTTTFAATELQNSIANACWAGEGTISAPYLINSQYDLEYLAYMARYTTFCNYYFELANDIALQGYSTATVATNSWHPIGGYTAVNAYESVLDTTFKMAFRGHFNGNNKTISNLYIRQDEVSALQAHNYSCYVGLFGMIGPGATIENVTVTGTILSIEVVGGIVGYARGTLLPGETGATGFSISGCSSNVKVDALYYAGGIVGRADDGAVTNCVNNSTVQRRGGLGSTFGASYWADSTDWVPRVAGWGYEIKVPKKTADSNQYPVYGCFGGIIGVGKNITVSGCTNSANASVNGTQSSWYAYIGGIIGFAMDASIIINCTNAGYVAGVHYLGGIVGTAIGTTTNQVNIINCQNTATNIASTGGVGGGILGYGNTVIVRACKNQAKVSGYTITAGIVGYVSGEARRGTADKHMASQVVDCVNNGAVNGYSYSGGIVGQSGTTSVEDDPTDSGSALSNFEVHIYYCRNNGNVVSSDRKCDTSKAGGVCSCAANSNGRRKHEYYDANGVLLGYASYGGSGVGGVVGIAGCTSVTACTNTADVEGGSRVGGLVGEQIYGQTMLCHNKGRLYITGADRTGERFWSGWDPNTWTDLVTEKDKTGPIAGGLVGYVFVNKETKIAACLNDIADANGYACIEGLTKDTDGTESASNGLLNHGFWIAVASRIGYARAKVETQQIYVDDSTSQLLTKYECARNFFLLIDRGGVKAKSDGMRIQHYGRKVDGIYNNAYQLFPRYFKEKFDVDDGDETVLNDAAAWTIQANNQIAVLSSGDNLFGNRAGTELDTDSCTKHPCYYYIALNLWKRNNNTIGGIYTYDGLKNPYYISFTSENPTGLETMDGQGQSKSILCALGNVGNAYTGATVTGTVHSVYTWPKATTDTGAITTNLKTITIEAPTVTNHIGTDGKRYYFVGYKDNYDRWWYPGAKVSDSILFGYTGEGASRTGDIILTAQWISGYSVRYAIAPSELASSKGEPHLMLPIDETLYADASAQFSVMAPTAAAGTDHFGYWLLKGDASGKRYYSNETYTLSQLGATNGEVVFYYERPTIDLSVTASMNGPFVEGQTDFVYELTTEADPNFCLRFIVKAQETVTITGLIDYGADYTLSVVTDWSWKYETRDGVLERYATENAGAAAAWETTDDSFTNLLTFMPGTDASLRSEKVHVTNVFAYYNGVYNTNLKGGVA